MPQINQLSAVSRLQAGDQLPVYDASNGDARKSSLTVLAEFLSTAFTSLTASDYIKVSAVSVANLPNAETSGAGARACVSDASVVSFNSVVAGGGSNTVPVFSDGSNWRVG